MDGKGHLCATKKHQHSTTSNSMSSIYTRLIHIHTHIHTHTLTHLSRVYSLKLDLYSNLKSQNRQSRGRGREMAGGRGGKREWEGVGADIICECLNLCIFDHSDRTRTPAKENNGIRSIESSAPRSDRYSAVQRGNDREKLALSDINKK